MDNAIKIISALEDINSNCGKYGIQVEHIPEEGAVIFKRYEKTSSYWRKLQMRFTLQDILKLGAEGCIEKFNKRDQIEEERYVIDEC